MSYYLIYGIHVIYKNIWKVAVFKGFEINIFITSVCSLSNLFFRFHTTTLTEACSNELKQHHL